jgi:hypothetical protein
VGEVLIKLLNEEGSGGSGKYHKDGHSFPLAEGLLLDRLFPQAANA